MKNISLIMLITVLGSAAASAQGDLSAFEQFRQQREVQRSDFEDRRAKEFEEFRTRYYAAFEQFRESYLRSLEEEEATVDLMASDDNIPIEPMKMAPAPPAVASTASEQKRILRESIRSIASMKPEDLVSAISDAADTVTQMRIAAEVMETIVAGMNADAQEDEAPTAAVSMTVVLDPGDIRSISGSAEGQEEPVSSPTSVIAAWEVTEEGEVRTVVGEDEEQAAPEAPADMSVPHGTPTDYVRVSSPFGSRIHPITHKRHGHKGVDLAAPRNTPVYATADGVVTFSGRNGGYGNFIKLNHQNGYKTAYAHLNRRAVREGRTVRKGDLIGYVGSTGASTGNHLHYEIYYQDKLIDPATTL